jgi:hypothetical protein
MFRVPASDWFGGSVVKPALVSGAYSSDGLAHVEMAGAVGSNTATPNPPALNPTTWDVEDTLWIAAVSADTSRTIDVYPSNMTLRRTGDVSGGAGGASLGIAMAESAAASFDPGTFTISASDDVRTTTVAVRPGAGAPPDTRVPYRNSMHALIAH